MDVCFNASGIFRILFICFAWYTQHVRKSELLCRIGTGMITIVLLKKKTVVLYFLGYSVVIDSALGWLFCKVNTVI